MERNIKKFIRKKNVICVELTKPGDRFGIFDNMLYLNYAISKNDNIFQIIIKSDKYLSVVLRYKLYSYENIDILSYANECSIFIDHINKKNMMSIIDKPINLQKLTVDYVNIKDADIIDKLYEKENIKYIGILCSINIELCYIYQIIKIKSLDVLHLRDETSGSISIENILNILWYVITNLNKDIKIEISSIRSRDYRETEYYLKLISYNFKVNENNYIFTYIPTQVTKFNYFYDFNLYYK